MTENKKKEIRIKKKVDENRLSWQADYSQFISPAWQKGVIIILLVLTVILIIIRYNFLTVVFLSLLIIVMMMRIKKSDKSIPVEIVDEKLIFGGRVIHFREIHSFWIDYEPGNIKELSIRQNKWFIPYLKIPIGNIDPVKIRDFLLDYILEEEHQEGFSDIISRKLGI